MNFTSMVETLKKRGFSAIIFYVSKVIIDREVLFPTTSVNVPVI